MSPLSLAIRDYLDQTGGSMRGLALAAGLAEKTVQQLVGGRTRRPCPAVLKALSAEVGLDLTTLPAASSKTAAELIAEIKSSRPEGWSESKRRGVVSALNAYVRAGGQGTHATTVSRAAIANFLSTASPASLGLTSANAFASYRSWLCAAAELAGEAPRKLRVDDIEGPWRDLFEAVRTGEPKTHVLALLGPFCVFCHEHELKPAEVGPAVFDRYLEHRLATGSPGKSEARQRRAVREVLGHWNRLAGSAAMSDFGIRAVKDIHVDGRDKFGVSSDALAPLLQEFDTRVAPWLRGEATADGRPLADVLTELDAAGPRPARKTRLVRKNPDARGAARRNSAALSDRLVEHGLLAPSERWSENTLRVGRAALVSLAKAFIADTGEPIEDMATLTAPDVAEAAADALDALNDNLDGETTYLVSCLKKLKKIACGYVRRPVEDVERLSRLCAAYKPARSGMAPRNLAKLRAFSRQRTDRFLSLRSLIVADVNAALEKSRNEDRRRHKRLRLRRDYMTPALARQLAVALLHELLLARAPRRSNALDVDLIRHVRRDPEGCVIVELPAAMTKGKEPLVIPLSPEASRLFEQFVEVARPLLLTDANRGATRLFPAPQSSDGRWEGLAKQLTREVLKRTGASLHIHLYRHLVGWIWLRDDPTRLPAVSKLLQHKNIQTTLAFYVELDETLALQQWHDYLERRQHDRDAA